MPTNFPAALDTTTQLPINRADGSTMASNHANDHDNANSALLAVEAKLGYGAGTPTNGLVLTGGVTSGTSAWAAPSGGGATTAYFSVRTRGAIGDGASHPITSGDIAAHPGWIGTYVAGDEWDYVGIQETLYACFAVNSTPGAPVWNGFNFRASNTPCYIPHGQYLLNKTLTINWLVGGLVYGDSRRDSILQKQTAGHLLATNGCGYSSFHGLSFIAGAAMGTDSALFSLDWDNTTGPNGAAALQANSFYDCQFDCQLNADYGLSIGWTGFMGSETSMFNCHWNSSLQGGLANWNYNALQNQVWGGNFASHKNHAIWCEAGGVNVYGTGFQNGTYSVVGGVPVTTQAGYDIYFNNNSSACAVISSCRSESLKILKVGAGRQVSLDALVTRSQTTKTWTANSTMNVGDCVGPAGRLYLCTTGGTSGSSQPAFNGGSTYTDGSVVWTFLDFDIVITNGGSITNCTLPWGRVQLAGAGPLTISNCMFSREDWVKGSPFAQAVNNVWIVLLNNMVQYSGQFTTGVPLPYTMSGAPGNARISSTAGVNFGQYPLVFSSGASGSAFGDVGIGPGDGDTTGSITRRILALYGALGQVTPVGTNLAGTDTYIYGGLSTGNGTPGTLHLATATSGASGAGVNLASDNITMSGTGLGFYGHAPAARTTASAAATDLATAITLVNNIRTALQSIGLMG